MVAVAFCFFSSFYELTSNSFSSLNLEGVGMFLLLIPPRLPMTSSFLFFRYGSMSLLHWDLTFYGKAFSFIVILQSICLHLACL